MYDVPGEFYANCKTEVTLVLSQKLCSRDEKHDSIRNSLHVVLKLNYKHQLDTLKNCMSSMSIDLISS